MSGPAFPQPFGPYELLRPLGRGGMAEVYLAKAHTAAGDRLVALKRMHAGVGEDQAAVEMLIAEARLAMRFTHPQIAATYELGCHEGVYFFVMEYVDGVDLGTVARAAEALGERMPAPLAVRIVAEVARGLHHAHTLCDENGQRLGVVHRDVSPQNVLINRQGEVKLIDFGVAKVATRIQQTMAGIIKGKYAYMSPEQASAEPVDARSDVFSLGICLWELLTGLPLFRRPEMSSPFAILRAVREEPLRRVDALVPALGPELGVIVAQALHRELSGRTPSAGALADALEAWLRRHAPGYGDDAVRADIHDLVTRAPPGTLPERLIATPAVAKMSQEAFVPSELSVVARSPLELADADTDPRAARRAAPVLSLDGSPPAQAARSGEGASAGHDAPGALAARAGAPPQDLRPSRRTVLQLLWVGVFALIFAFGWSVVATLKRLGKV